MILLVTRFSVANHIVPNDNLIFFWVKFLQNVLDCFIFVISGVQICTRNGQYLLTTPIFDVGQLVEDNV